MFFVCNHTNNGKQELYAGSNQADWKSLSAIGSVGKADRDRRLATYIPLAKNAYYALKRTKKVVTLPGSMANLRRDAKRYQARTRAIAAMRDGPHQDFLGRKTEIGQAFSRTMKPRQCCYFCKGMMGYGMPSIFKQEDIENYLCHIEWHLRG